MQSKRIATVLTAAALATALAAPATAWADPTPAPVESGTASQEPTPPTPGGKEVKADGGFVKLTLAANLLDGLKAKGVVLTQLTADCKVPKDETGKPYLPPVTALSLGVQAGEIAAVDAKIAGNVAFADTCIGMVNAKGEKGVVLSNLAADLSTGTITAKLQNEKGVTDVKLGTFERPALDAKTVDVAANAVALDAAVNLDAALAAQVNADLGVNVLVGGGPLLAIDSEISLDNAVNLAVDLGLDLNLNANANVNLVTTLGGVLGGLLGGGK
ncbi:hypothetical protein [Streptomyces sp. NBC_01304]|uniref:hypothetical protein n=1 Tax=Streptomyces sp. NBC_01304 TaxID=2903818 RepID=UPI002E0D6C15|nr:hypothetical protein OG430_26175 [Streptomyces sp. NBC_01304]